MKYFVPQDVIYRIVFKYLDVNYGDLQKYEPKYYKGFILKKPSDDSNYGVIAWKVTKNLWISSKLEDEIHEVLSTDDFKLIERIIRKWFESRFNVNIRGKMDLTMIDTRNIFKIK